MAQANKIYLKDYQAPAFFIKKTYLRFELEDGISRVSSDLHMQKNMASSADASRLVLDGQELSLISVAIDGQVLDAGQYELDESTLTILNPKDEFRLQIVVDIEPEKNTSLEGLYRSRGMYCTQCEAEGFRKITYYLDRPDVMSEFEVTLVADEGKFPVMLSNGNCIDDQLVDGKRIVTWHDPHLKPCYLFALVAGELQCIEDSFMTMSGREVLLQIFVEEKDLDKCDHAMRSLKNAMKWDEEVYGREYDLDIFMIVAVDDFNMGAMENKGLNIFNTSCVLAHPKTTTDAGFERVEAVVAHEYFHNWSGNRVTCRDWFQLSLKEGFTVYRDAEFSADMNSRAVKRIEDARFLRSVQFAEDAGPMAHAVRPESFIEISNFYTVTIYEKGAEVVRMLANILGPELFRKATDLYFDRHDGQAVTCEDFVKAMEDASGYDLQQFRLWYSQAGTPRLLIDDEYDEDQRLYRLRVVQDLPETPESKQKQAQHIPLKMALFGEAGAFALNLQGQPDAERADNTEIVLHVDQFSQEFVFENIAERPLPSLLRGFSAPVNFRYNYTDEQLARLVGIDNDGFCRWDAAQTLMVRVMNLAVAGEESKAEEVQGYLVASLKTLLEQDISDPAMVALILTLPSEQYIADGQRNANPEKITAAFSQLRQLIAEQLKTLMIDQYRFIVSNEQCNSAGWRSLKNCLLTYLVQLDDREIAELCWEQFTHAQNMTDQSAALRCLLNGRSTQHYCDQASELFYQQWRDENLVVNMWMQLQASAESERSLSKVKALLEHEKFEYTNPNKVRSVVASFSSMNFSGFHAADGSGYAFLADQIIHMNALNPQIASRLIVPLSKWRKLDSSYADLMHAQLQRIANTDNLSKDVYEQVSKSLAD